MKKYGAYTEDVKCMMAAKLTSMIASTLKSINYSDPSNVLSKAAFMDGASAIVESIMTELDKDKDEE